MERDKPCNTVSNSDIICHEEDSDADCVDSLGRSDLIRFGNDEKKKEEEEDKKEENKDKENKEDESHDNDYTDKDEVQQVNIRETLSGKPISPTNIIPR